MAAVRLFSRWRKPWRNWICASMLLRSVLAGQPRGPAAALKTHKVDESAGLRERDAARAVPADALRLPSPSDSAVSLLAYLWRGISRPVLPTKQRTHRERHCRAISRATLPPRALRVRVRCAEAQYAAPESARLAQERWPRGRTCACAPRQACPNISYATATHGELGLLTGQDEPLGVPRRARVSASLLQRADLTATSCESSPPPSTSSARDSLDHRAWPICGRISIRRSARGSLALTQVVREEESRSPPRASHLVEPLARHACRHAPAALTLPSALHVRALL